MVGVWQLLAMQLQLRLLPAPGQVLDTLWQHWQSGELSLHLGATLARVGVSFSLSLLLGALIGIAMGCYPTLDRWLDPLLLLLLNMPALVTIILLYIWLGMNELSALLAVVLNKVPNVVVTLREGARCLDRQFIELAQVYRVPRLRRLRELILPQLIPYFLIAARSGLALVWKIVLVVELLGRSNGVGFQLHLAFQMFDVPVILAYSLAFIGIVQSVEWLLLQPWERRQRRWREAES
ncbi:MAG: ABC-type nitrate/sulfonate/bicarbonate transport system permease component [Motiliproteus sp.]